MAVTLSVIVAWRALAYSKIEIPDCSRPIKSRGYKQSFLSYHFSTTLPSTLSHRYFAATVHSHSRRYRYIMLLIEKTL